MTKQEYLAHIDKVIEQGKYKADWASMKNMETPEWYRDAKFGIFVHWGIFSVPAAFNEWYSRNMYIKDSPEYKHHIAAYGEHKSFGYKDFIPLFKGENFNADEWLMLFSEAGARYVMPVAEHHDGFMMYDSDLSEYTAVNMGPKRDVLSEIKKSCEKHNVQFCASSHRIEHWWFFGNGREYESDVSDDVPGFELYSPAVKEPACHFDLFPEPPSREFLEDWLVRCCELADKYKPRVFYFDWWIQIEAAKPYLKKFAAYYYNRGLEWGTPVAINYKHDAFPYGSAVLEYERGQATGVMHGLWQTCTSTARNSWCYTNANVYKTAQEIVCDLIDIVSKNGCLLLNVGPKADGTIPVEEQRILRDIGAWLKINGEAVYGSRPFKVFGEGSTEIKEGNFMDGEAKGWSSGDIRFTVNGANLYVTVMKYPEDGIVTVKTLRKGSPVWNGIIRGMQILGFSEKEEPEYERTDNGLVIKTTNVKSGMPAVFKLLLD